MRISAEDYRQACGRRLQEARVLYNEGIFSGATYLTGAAVECLPRAYMVRKGGEIDTRHDLRMLFERSGLIDYIPFGSVGEVKSLLRDVWTRWDNLYRFMSDDRLRSEYRRRKLHAGIRGDFLKENARRVLAAAEELREIGEKRWDLKRK